MEYNVFIADMSTGAEIEGFYLLKAAYPKVTAAGKPFLSAVIADASGNTEMKVWDYSGPVGPADAGKIIKVRGEVSEYRGTPQITARRIRLASESDSFDISRLIPVAPIDENSTFEYVRSLVDSITDNDYKYVCETILDEYGKAFRSIPAAKSYHHSFIGGLLMHTSNMLRAADFFSTLYPEVIDRSLLIAGTLMHDLAKNDEFLFSELGIVTDYSVKGQLLGHLVMGAQTAGIICAEKGIPDEKSILLQHMILSHHGEPEFGAAVRPMCAEAELLSFLDGIDSRMEIYTEELSEIPAGEFSQRIPALDKKIYRHF